jgi:hypothetical protein
MGNPNEPQKSERMPYLEACDRHRRYPHVFSFSNQSSNDINLELSKRIVLEIQDKKIINVKSEIAGLFIFRHLVYLHRNPYTSTTSHEPTLR